MSRAVLLQTQQQLCRACSTCGKTAAGDGSPKQVCISITQAFTFHRSSLRDTKFLRVLAMADSYLLR